MLRIRKEEANVKKGKKVGKKFGQLSFFRYICS